MKISSQEFEHIAVLTLSGEFTADDTDAFQRATEERRRAGARHIVLDCQHLEFVDSKGLECWIGLQETLGDQGGQLRLIVPLGDVARAVHGDQHGRHGIDDVGQVVA